MPRFWQPPRAAALVAALLMPAAGAWAQSLDHGALEQLFREPVTTSVTGKPQRVSEAPAAIEIITREDIRRSGATTIPEALAFVAGVDVRPSGLAGVNVGVRGYNQPFNPRLMVLVDGREVYSADYGRIPWIGLPVQLDEIRQIEVIKGPNSALYGFNATGGVINIVTFGPLTEPVNAVTLRGGTQSLLSGSAVATARAGETAGLRLSAGGFTARDFAPGPLSELDRSSRRPPRAGSFNADGRWRVTPDVEAFASASYGDSRVSEPILNAAYYTGQTQAHSIRGGVAAETAAGRIMASLYRNDAYYGFFTAIPPAPTLLGVRLRETVTVAQVSDLVKLGAAHTLRVSLEYRTTALSSDFVRGTVWDESVAAGVMWDWRITPEVEMTNALRVDHARLRYVGTLSPYSGQTAAQFNAVRITEPSLNSGVVWKATERDSFRFGLARGVQFPALLSQGAQFDYGANSPFAYYGRPDTRPAITWNAELGYDRALPAIGSALRAAVFAQRTDDVIASPFNVTPSFTPTGGLRFQAGNVGYSTAAGVEVGIKGRNDSGWRWNASYALVATTDHTSLNQGPLPTSPVVYARGTPAHVVVLGLGYARGRWEADAMARWQSSFVDYRSYPFAPLVQRVSIDNHVTINARVGFRVAEGVTVAAVAQQLNSRRLATSATVPTERRLIATLALRF